MRLHHVRIGMRVLSVLLVVGLASSGAATAQPTFTVNSVLDIPGGGDLADGVCETAAGDGICTLRAAVMEANRVPGGGASVVVPANRYVLTRPPVVETEEASGDLDVLVAMTIEGDGASATVVEANAIDAVFDVSGGPVFMRRLGVESSSPLDGNRCIRNSGDLTLSDVAVRLGVGSARSPHGARPAAPPATHPGRGGPLRRSPRPGAGSAGASSRRSPPRTAGTRWKVGAGSTRRRPYARRSRASRGMDCWRSTRPAGPGSPE